MAIQLVAFDLDGTLMGGDLQIRPAVRYAIARAQALGVKITLATGRMFSATLPFARELGITTPLLCYQGGWIQADGDEAPRYRIPLPLDLTRSILTLAGSRNWGTVLYADGRIFLQEMRYSLEFYQTLLGVDLNRVADWEPVLEAAMPDKILFVAEPAEIPRIGAVLRETLAGRAEVMRSHECFMEVVPLGVDKGRGLAWLAQQLAIPQSAVMAVGDQENDGPMIRWAGIGVAMGNAIPELQVEADWVAPSLEADGAAAALERFVFGPNSAGAVRNPAGEGRGA